MLNRSSENRLQVEQLEGRIVLSAWNGVAHATGLDIPPNHDLNPEERGGGLFNPNANANSSANLKALEKMFEASARHSLKHGLP